MKLKDDGDLDISDKIGLFIGNSQVTLNMVEQLSQHLQNISSFKDEEIKIYDLSDEIDYCLDRFTASSWEKQVQVYPVKD